MKKQTIVSIAMASLMVMGGLIATVAADNIETLDGGGNQFMQRIRNRICDVLGICQGGCNLTEITGILEYDETNFFIGEVELHFGPNWYITSVIAAEDYDGDGEEELVIDELIGLVGTEVTVEGYMQSEDWMSVFTINGMVYREPGQPIWAAQHHWRWRKRHNEP